MSTIDKSSNYYGMPRLPRHEDEGIRDKELENSIEAQSLIGELSFKERIDLTNKENRELNDNLKKLETLGIDPAIKAVIKKALEKKISINEKKLLELVKGNQVINGDTIKAVKGKPDTEIIKTLTGKKERIKPVLNQLAEYNKEMRTADKQLEQADKILSKFVNLEKQFKKINKDIKAIDDSIEKLKSGDSSALDKLQIPVLEELKKALNTFQKALSKQKDKLESNLKNFKIQFDTDKDKDSKDINEKHLTILKNIEKEFNTETEKAIENYASDFKKISNQLKTIQSISEKKDTIAKTKEQLEKVIKSNEDKIQELYKDEQSTSMTWFEIQLIKQINKLYKDHLNDIEKSFLKINSDLEQTVSASESKGYSSDVAEKLSKFNESYENILQLNKSKLSEISSKAEQWTGDIQTISQIKEESAQSYKVTSFLEKENDVLRKKVMTSLNSKDGNWFLEYQAASKRQKACEKYLIAMYRYREKVEKDLKSCDDKLFTSDLKNVFSEFKKRKEYAEKAYKEFVTELKNSDHISRVKLGMDKIDWVRERIDDRIKGGHKTIDSIDDRTSDFNIVHLVVDDAFGGVQAANRKAKNKEYKYIFKLHDINLYILDKKIKISKYIQEGKFALAEKETIKTGAISKRSMIGAGQKLISDYSDISKDLDKVRQRLNTTEKNLKIARNVCVVAAATVATVATGGASAPILIKVVAGTAAGTTIGLINNTTKATFEVCCNDRDLKSALVEGAIQTGDDAFNSFTTAVGTATGAKMTGALAGKAPSFMRLVGASVVGGNAGNMTSTTIVLVKGKIEAEAEIRLLKNPTDKQKTEIYKKHGLSEEQIKKQLALGLVTSTGGAAIGTTTNAAKNVIAQGVQKGVIRSGTGAIAKTGTKIIDHTSQVGLSLGAASTRKNGKGLDSSDIFESITNHFGNRVARPTNRQSNISVNSTNQAQKSPPPPSSKFYEGQTQRLVLAVQKQTGNKNLTGSKVMEALDKHLESKPKLSDQKLIEHAEAILTAYYKRNGMSPDLIPKVKVKDLGGAYGKYDEENHSIVLDRGKFSGKVPQDTKGDPLSYAKYNNFKNTVLHEGGGHGIFALRRALLQPEHVHTITKQYFLDQFKKGNLTLNLSNGNAVKYGDLPKPIQEKLLKFLDKSLSTYEDWYKTKSIREEVASFLDNNPELLNELTKRFGNRMDARDSLITLIADKKTNIAQILDPGDSSYYGIASLKNKNGETVNLAQLPNSPFDPSHKGIARSERSLINFLKSMPGWQKQSNGSKGLMRYFSSPEEYKSRQIILRTLNQELDALKKLNTSDKLVKQEISRLENDIKYFKSLKHIDIIQRRVANTLNILEKFRPDSDTYKIALKALEQHEKILNSLVKNNGLDSEAKSIGNNALIVIEKFRKEGVTKIKD